MDLTIKATDFIYPTKEEREKASKEYPKLYAFDFKPIDELSAAIEGRLKAEEIHKASNLYAWDSTLKNKLWNLHLSYISTVTHYSRGIPDGKKVPFTEENVINKIQFDFYTETFYYYFISTRDIIAQIANVYKDLNFKEHQVTVEKVIKKLGKGNTIGAALSKFNTETSDANEKIRNALTHRFPVNRSSSRTTFTIHPDGRRELGFGGGIQYSPEKLILNMKDSLSHLNTLLQDLKKVVT